MRVPASVYSAYDCSVFHVRCEASPERLAASGTAGGSHPSVICDVNYNLLDNEVLNLHVLYRTMPHKLYRFELLYDVHSIQHFAQICSAGSES